MLTRTEAGVTQPRPQRPACGTLILSRRVGGGPGSESEFRVSWQPPPGGRGAPKIGFQELSNSLRPGLSGGQKPGPGVVFSGYFDSESDAKEAECQ